MSANRTAGPLPIPRVTLIALFVTALITSQVTASKIVAIDLPVTLPVVEGMVLVPAAAFAYAVTFFASDCYAELYGRQDATRLVNVAFGMNFVLLGLVWLAIEAPFSPTSQIGQSAFADVLGSSSGIVAGSLLAYLVSQNLDVFTFHWLRNLTDARMLWLRNIGSTLLSQAVDTVIFITVAFVVVKGIAPSDAVTLIIGQYLVKLAVALLDTPFVYAVVAFVRRRDGASSPIMGA